MPEVITAWGAAELLRRIADRQVSIREVVEAYVARLRAVHSSHNLLTCERFELALQEAKAFDEQGRIPNPSHRLAGLPVTIKDCFNVEGLPTNLGVARHPPASSDAAAVRTLRQAGAIVLGKTNVPQLMLAWETNNPLHGRTLHPTHADRSPGGSSGGEAATVALHASALGLGSDLLGSIRFPAHACGICGLKPSSQLVDCSGLQHAFPSVLPVPTSIGPLARRTEDLALWLEVILDGHANLRLREPVPSHRPLRCAIWTSDPAFPARPPVKRCMEQLRLDLADHGVEVVDLAIPNTQELVDWGIPVFFCDRLRQSRGLLRGQMVDAHVRRLLRCLNMPGVLRRSLIQTGRLTGGKRLANTLQALRPLNVKGLLHCLGRIHDMRDAFLQAWREAEIDAVITPAFPVTAFRHGESPRYSGGFGMLLMANLWDLPAGVVPVGVVEKDSSSDVVATSSSEARQRQPAAADDLEADGLPIGAQVIGGLLGDRTVIQVMKLLEKLHNDD